MWGRRVFEIIALLVRLKRLLVLGANGCWPSTESRKNYLIQWGCVRRAQSLVLYRMARNLIYDSFSLDHYDEYRVVCERVWSYANINSSPRAPTIGHRLIQPPLSLARRYADYVLSGEARHHLSSEKNETILVPLLLLLLLLVMFMLLWWLLLGHEIVYFSTRKIIKTCPITSAEMYDAGKWTLIQ